MRNYLISEIIYWVIAIISIFSVFENWNIVSFELSIFYISLKKNSNFEIIEFTP